MPLRVHADDLPGEGALVRVLLDGTPVALARVDGVVHAFQDTCTHVGCSLAKGGLEGRSVVCPCHQGVFDVATGAVLSGPPKAPLRTFSVTAAPDGIELGG